MLSEHKIMTGVQAFIYNEMSQVCSSTTTSALVLISGDWLARGIDWPRALNCGCRSFICGCACQRVWKHVHMVEIMPRSMIVCPVSSEILSSRAIFCFNPSPWFLTAFAFTLLIIITFLRTLWWYEGAAYSSLRGWWNGLYSVRVYTSS